MSNEENTANTFRDRFLNVTSLGESLIEGAKLGRLPSILNEFEIELLIANGEPYTLTDNRSLIESISARIRLACLRGELKAELSDRDVNGVRSEKKTYCYIHRDDARRYFSKLGLEPDAGSPLWCWLRDKAAGHASKPGQQDKADFQQACLGVWKVSPTTTITGDAGIVNHSDVRAYLKKYKPGTLESWAREVAPHGVKGKRGAPRKNMPLAKK